jgi:hypothetical protein
MSKTASLGFAPSTIFSRLFASIDRLLLACAEMTIRNGDVSRCDPLTARGGQSAAASISSLHIGI